MTKVSKVSVDYTSRSKHPETMCKGCHHYNGDGSCKIVTGTINPLGWCSKWIAVQTRLKEMAGAK